MEPITVLGVFVGQPRVIGVGGDGQPVTSAIGKEPVTESSVAVGPGTIAGDAQADPTVHGGPDKVVYAYPAPHYAAWRAAGFALEVGGLGENLALDGASEHDVRIGDVWRWGDALLQVSQPRAPCYKLALHVGRRGAGREMVRTGRCGWYLRVLSRGVAPTAGLVERVGSDPAEPTVAEAFAAVVGPRPGRDDDAVARVRGSAHLAAQWRAALAR
jgi:MOSC domain-containing protein YiiM